MPAGTSTLQRASDLASGMLTGPSGVQLIRPKAPHLGQQEFLNSNHKRRLIVAHRRWGKDWVCCMEIIARCQEWAKQLWCQQPSPPISWAMCYSRSSDNGTQSPGARWYRQAFQPSEAFFVTA